MEETKMRLSKIFGSMAIALFAALISSTSVKADDSNYRAMFMELRDNMRNYKQTEILPQMRQWKSKLDESMSSEDLAKLNELRAKAAEMRGKAREEIKRNRERGNRGEGYGRGEGRGKGRGYGKGEGSGEGRGKGKGMMREMAKDLKPLAEKYRDVLEQIAGECKEISPQWRENGAKIVEEWHSKYESQLDEIRENCEKQIEDGERPDRPCRGLHMVRQGLEREKRGGHFGFNMDGRRAVARFMLWDGKEREHSDEPEENLGDNLLGFDESDMLTLDGPSNFPNPFASTTTINFSIPKGGSVKVYVVDNSGKTVATLLDKNISAGEHSVVFDATKSGLSALPNGTYFYKIEAPGYSDSGKMSLSR